MSNPLDNDDPDTQFADAYFDKANAPRRGRPTPKDPELISRRDELLWLLSVKWYEIGWELPKAKTMDQLRSALNPLKGHPYSDRVVQFLHTTTTPSSTKEIRALRKRRGKAIETLRNFQFEFDRYDREARTAEIAMNEADSNSQHILFANLLKRWAECKHAKANLNEGQAVVNKLQQELASKEACLCQNELLDFIDKGKYARDPEGFANAMAGLPDLTWGTSRDRCAKTKPNSVFAYRVFETIDRIWNTREKYVNLPTTELFRQEILKLPKTMLEKVSGLIAREKGKKRIEMPNNLRTYLVDNWPYLKWAIDEVEAAKFHPKRVPFLIASAFEKAIAKPRRPEDVVRAQLDKIE